MKKTQAFFFCLVVAAILGSCKRNVEEGHGKIITDSRKVSTFTAVEINTTLDAVITIDSTASPSVALKGYGNLLEKLVTKVENNTLNIDKDGIIDFYTDKHITADITVPSLSSLSIKGATDAVIKGIIKGDKFVLKVSGAGDVTIENIVAQSFESTLSGAGDLTIQNGVVNSASFNVRGAGDVSAFSLACKQASAKVSGAGDIEVNVSEKLDAHISGAGSITYKGHPQVSSNIKGIGEVEDGN